MSDEVGAVGSPDGEEAIVAFLRITSQGDGTATTEFVVGPEYRSLGIATLLFEELGLARGGAARWAGEGVRSLRAWAHGLHPRRSGWRAGSARCRERVVADHPADAPAGQRAGAGTSRRVDLRPLHPESDTAVVAALADAEKDGRGAGRVGPEVLVAVEASGEVLGFVAYSPHPLTGEAPDGPGSVHLLAPPTRGEAHAVSRALLAAALKRLAEAGVREVEMSVDPLDEPLVRACRSVGFHHDQTDVCFSVPVDAPAAVA
ncbi:hypothetical protein ACR6C2_42985 [Streptomyces sp. INA 01156]